MNDTETIFKTAFESHQNKDLESAAKGYLEILSHEPNHANALHLMGLVHLDRGEYESALPLIEKSLEFAPDELQWQLNYGKLLSKSGKIEQAIKAYLKVLSMSVDCTDVQSALSDLYCKTGDFTKALRFNNSNQAAMKGLSDRCRETGNYTEALLSYYKILCDHPENKDISNKYADIITNMGLPEEADRFLDWYNSHN